MAHIMFSSLVAAAILAVAAVPADAAMGKRKVTGSAAAPNARSYVTGYYALDLDGVSQQRPAKRTFRSKGRTWQSNKGKQKSGWNGWSGWSEFLQIILTRGAGRTGGVERYATAPHARSRLPPSP